MQHHETTPMSRKWKARLKVERGCHRGRYEDIERAARAAGDDGFCAVAAMATAFGCSYKTMAALAAEHGRQFGKGTAIWNVIDAIAERFGKRVEVTFARADTMYGEHVARTHGATLSDKGFSLKTVTDRLPRGRHIVLIRRHALAVRNGHIHDWTATDSRALQVQVVFTVRPREQ